jgi:hypothetical protein
MIAECHQAGDGSRWLAENRSPDARHWNMLTFLTDGQMSYAT